MYTLLIIVSQKLSFPQGIMQHIPYCTSQHKTLAMHSFRHFPLSPPPPPPQKWRKGIESSQLRKWGWQWKNQNIGIFGLSFHTL